jgi:SRSO17 transposase
MDILEHPDAQALLADAELSAAAVRGAATHLEAFMARYLPLFPRLEHRAHAHTVLEGKLTGLERKTTEPIARQAGQQRRPLQLFVGAGGWVDDAVLAELRRHVAEELADPDGVWALDGSGFPKKGTHSCGVGRQWCGRLGKVENCQVGVFLGYASRRGKALLDARLYLPKDWAEDPPRRAATFVPAAVVFQEGWRIALGLLDTARGALPDGWVTGDDEFGRCSELRAQLRLRRRRYVLDVPCNTLVRDPQERRPATRPGGKPRLPEFERVDHWAARQPGGRWRTVKVRDGEKGPREVQVLVATVQTREEDGCVGPRERLAIFRTCEPKPQTWYTLSNAQEAKRAALAQAHAGRHRVEELLAEGKGQAGLAQYEVRSWVGWHHHMTLSLLALWFLELERVRLGEKNAGGDGATGTGGVHGTPAPTRGRARPHRGRGQPSAAA